VPTSFPMANPWSFNEQVDDVKLNARITTPINDLAATVNTAAPAAVFPGQVVGTVATSTNATSSGTNGVTEALLPGSLLAVAGIVAGRSYFVEFGCRFVVSAAATTAAVVVHASQSAITTASPVIYTGQKYCAAGGATQDEQSFRFLWVPGASGTWNFELGVKSTSGTGNSQITNGSNPVTLTVVAA
jgi:hypothetical protein